MDESPDWFRLGVEARIAGRPRTENPLLGPGALPEVTGQSFGAWRAAISSSTTTIPRARPCRARRRSSD